MQPTKFDGFNSLYRPTAEGLQEDLPAKRTDKTVVTRWLPTAEEIQRMSRGGAVELTIFGGQPPVAMRVV
ncbi:MAG: hypothetical protein WBB98_04500 [Xanthobacteraceae bacterium]